MSQLNIHELLDDKTEVKPKPTARKPEVTGGRSNVPAAIASTQENGYHFTMNILETDRLILCQFSTDDAAFILELLNEDSFIRFIRDSGVRTLADAREYIVNGPLASYERHGFGLYLTKLKAGEVPIGMCGLLKRDSLDDVDIGFAFLPRYWSQGYATEAASAVLAYGRTVLGLQCIVAITAPDNHGSINVLKKIGFRFDKIINLPDDGGDSMLFTLAALDR
jgi:RimJ/RimL family protein N-acetyltransferase